MAPHPSLFPDLQWGRWSLTMRLRGPSPNRRWHLVAEMIDTQTKQVVSCVVDPEAMVAGPHEALDWLAQYAAEMIDREIPPFDC